MKNDHFHLHNNSCSLLKRRRKKGQILDFLLYLQNRIEAGVPMSIAQQSKRPKNHSESLEIRFLFAIALKLHTIGSYLKVKPNTLRVLYSI